MSVIRRPVNTGLMFSRGRWIAGPAADIGPGFIPAISLLYFLIWIRSLRRENVP